MERIEKRNISHIEIHRLFCDKCGIEMHHIDGMELPTDPPSYPHICPQCGGTVNMDKVMPYTEFIFGDAVE